MKYIPAISILAAALLTAGCRSNLNDEQVQQVRAVLDSTLYEGDYSKLRAIYRNLDEDVKKSPEGKALKEELRKMGFTAVDGVAPSFTLPGPDGSSHSPQDFRGHWLLIDFWASWCNPCMEEIPYVKACFEKYHDKGLRILGVSLDTSKEQWKHCADALPWCQVSSLRGFECPVAILYNIAAIPQTVLIRPDGRIEATGLRGPMLLDKLSGIYE